LLLASVTQQAEQQDLEIFLFSTFITLVLTTAKVILSIEVLLLYDLDTIFRISSGCLALASHNGASGLVLGLLYVTKWHWSRFSSTKYQSTIAPYSNITAPEM
jgi:hypothetical protein